IYGTSERLQRLNSYEKKIRHIEITFITAPIQQNQEVPPMSLELKEKLQDIRKRLLTLRDHL
ncbi:MAG: hypothetical protein KAI75_02465, partial [Desulfobulbaceae bacterium]|nr:hypothetical protein [Desulfobulbaceae bacterium]